MLSSSFILSVSKLAMLTVATVLHCLRVSGWPVDVLFKCFD